MLFPSLERAVRVGAALLALTVVACSLGTPGGMAPPAIAANRDLEAAIANDNRAPGGTLDGRGVRHLRLEARLAAWRPDLDVDTVVTVQAFAEEDGPPRIPGPLLRVPQGTEVRVSIRNSLPDSTLVVHGLRAGTVPADTLHVPPGAVREVSYRAGAPGTYLYWAATGGDSIHHRHRRDSQLTGAIVIDPAGGQADPDERIFVMTVIDLYPDSVRNPAKEDIWELAINGLAWPHTERLTYPVGDTVRWRWLNGSYLSHPMHLHGFHFRVLARGGGHADTTYTADVVREAVTEFMPAGSTFRMEWVPTRAGHWLMHCHMIPHITPYPERADSLRHHDLHEVERHPLIGMAGLVLGISTVERDGRAAAAVSTPARQLRLLAQEAPADSGKPVPRGYVLQQGTEPRADSVAVPGTPLVLTRGETTAITVVNRLSEPTTVHWHGMELESVFDGVAGWSRTGSGIAPLLAAGDSFTVTMTPPRAGTFIYHTHMDEGTQLPHGMYGPLLVLEPGEVFDPATDLVLMIGRVAAGDGAHPALNGRTEPVPLELRAGTPYRLRLINILPVMPARVELRADGEALSWRALAKDGAELPRALRVERPARLTIDVGETYDFEWTPAAPMEAVLLVRLPEGDLTLRQPVRVRR